jgi:hypothetical protein
VTTQSDGRALQLLRAALPVPDSAPPPDLWPRVRAGLDRRSPLSTADWVVLVAIATLCLLQPTAVSVLLLHF